MAEKEKDGEATAEAPKKSKKMLIILLSATILIGGGGGGFLYWKSTKSEAAAAATTPAAVEAETPALVSLDTFLVNLNDPQGDRYLKLTMRLAVAPESVAEQVSTDELLLARLRDRVLNVLMRKTFSELSNPLGKDGLRLEIETAINDLLETGTVHDVLFAEFVVQ